MDTTITVNIYNWNCLENGQNMVIDVSANMLVLNDLGSAAAPKWILIPNLVVGAQTGGYTIFNPSLNLSAEQPTTGNQIPLGDDPTPYGSASYCWTLWAAGTSNSGEQLWAIQSAQRGPAMDAQRSSCSGGTPVLFYNWNGGDNQRWVIRKL